MEQCFVCPNCTSSNKTVTFGCVIDKGVTYKPFKTPRYLVFGLYFELRSVMSRFANGNILSTRSQFIRQGKMNIQTFCLFAIFRRADMLGIV